MILGLRNFKAQYNKSSSWFTYPNVELKTGTILVIMGKTGCGKTTLLNALLGLSFTGSVNYEQADLLGKDLHCWGRDRYKYISYMPQYAQNGLNPSMTVGEQIAMVRRCCENFLDEKMELYFTELGLEKGLTEMYPFQLSGGMKQRVAMTIGFLKNPRLFVLDEPSSALDYITLDKTINFLKKRKAEDCSIIVVTHDKDLAAGIADQILEL